MCIYDDALTHKKKQDKAHSGVRVGVLNVEVSVSGHVVIGVGIVIVQRHHAIITNSEFSLFSPIVNLLSGCMIRSSLLSCTYLLHTFAPR